MSSTDWKEKIVNTLLEFDGDAKRGYFHEPRTEKEIIEIFSQELLRQKKEIINIIINTKKDVVGLFPGTDTKIPTTELGNKVLCKEYYNKALDDILKLLRER